MAAKPVVLVLGAGPRVGAAVAEKFASNGFKVAVASRSGKSHGQSFLSLKADFTDPESIRSLFDAVKTEFHAAPTVVVYNAAAMTPPPDKDSMFSISAQSVASDLNVNTITPYAAAQQAVKEWKTLPKETKKTFIYTGNFLNVNILPMPMMMDLGMGKSASAYWLGLADAMHSAQGIRFFYADERFGDGKSKSMELDGAAHADFYMQLTKHENIPWHATFVKDKGYAKF